MYDAHHQERIERYHKVHALRAQGAELTLIAHHVGISRTTVNKYLNMEHPPARKTGKRSGSVIDPYKEYIVKRWNDGVRNARALSIVKSRRWAILAQTTRSTLFRAVSERERSPEIQAG
jgi:transposase